MLCNVPVTLHTTDVIVVSYIQSLLITIHYNSVLHSHIFYSTYDIKHVVVRLSQKTNSIQQKQQVETSQVRNPETRREEQKHTRK